MLCVMCYLLQIYLPGIIGLNFGAGALGAILLVYNLDSNSRHLKRGESLAVNINFWVGQLKENITK